MISFQLAFLLGDRTCPQLDKWTRVVIKISVHHSTVILRLFNETLAEMHVCLLITVLSLRLQNDGIVTFLGDIERIVFVNQGTL